MRGLGMSKPRLGGGRDDQCGPADRRGRLLIGEFLAQPLASWRMSARRSPSIPTSVSPAPGAPDPRRRHDPECYRVARAWGGIAACSYSILAAEYAGGRRHAEHARALAAQSWELEVYAESRFTDHSVPTGLQSSRRDLQHGCPAPNCYSLPSATRPSWHWHHAVPGHNGTCATIIWMPKQYVICVLGRRLARTAGILGCGAVRIAIRVSAPFRSASLTARMTARLALGLVYFFMQAHGESGNAGVQPQPAAARHGCRT